MPLVGCKSRPQPAQQVGAFLAPRRGQPHPIRPTDFRPAAPTDALLRARAFALRSQPLPREVGARWLVGRCRWPVVRCSRWRPVLVVATAIGLWPATPPATHAANSAEVRKRCIAAGAGERQGGKQPLVPLHQRIWWHATAHSGTRALLVCGARAARCDRRAVGRHCVCRTELAGLRGGVSPSCVRACQAAAWRKSTEFTVATL